jgi:hypothetical protein
LIAWSAGTVAFSPARLAAASLQFRIGRDEGIEFGRVLIAARFSG